MKMEGIELYPHNQKAYDNLCAMLRDSNRACVVQPTGTGKFVIIAKMAQDNPGKNFLLLGTSAMSPSKPLRRSMETDR